MKRRINGQARQMPMELEGIRQYKGSDDAGGLDIGIVVSLFHNDFTGSLLRSALTCLEKRGAMPDDIEVFWVPGAYEIPVVASRMAESGRYDAIIALGCVIEGETQHAELISKSVSRALTEIACDFDVPVINEVVSARNEEQAAVRCIYGADSRGWYAAEAAVQMARLVDAMDDAWDAELLEEDDEWPWVAGEKQ